MQRPKRLWVHRSVERAMQPDLGPAPQISNVWVVEEGASSSCLRGDGLGVVDVALLFSPLSRSLGLQIHSIFQHSPADVSFD